jgi:thioredoxin-like negative regulator of GroEL
VTWQDGLLLFLSIVDVSALVVGLTVLRRVTRLVRDAGEQIHESVMESIDEAQGHAVRRLVEVVAPVLEEIANDKAGSLKVAKLDVDANPQTAQQFQVVSIPTLILFKNGQPTKRITGAKGKTALLRELADSL